MAIVPWSNNLDEIMSLLRDLSCSDKNGEKLDAEEGFVLWMKKTLQLRAERRTAFLVGNGASASMASHMAADLAKNAQLHTEVFSDLSLITAISNDMGFDRVFSEPLSRRAASGDMLVAISSSGESPNVLGAVSAARKCEMTVVTLSGMAKENKLKMAGDINFHVNAKTYGHVESSHAVILHHWMDIVEQSIKEQGI